MKIKLVVVGKLKEKYLKDGIAEYVKRMGTMLPLEIIELADEKIPDNASEKEAEALKKREGDKIFTTECSPIKISLEWAIPVPILLIVIFNNSPARLVCHLINVNCKLAYFWLN